MPLPQCEQRATTVSEVTNVELVECFGDARERHRPHGCRAVDRGRVAPGPDFGRITCPRVGLPSTLLPPRHRFPCSLLPVRLAPLRSTTVLSTPATVVDPSHDGTCSDDFRQPRTGPVRMIGGSGYHPFGCIDRNVPLLNIFTVLTYRRALLPFALP